MNGLNSVTISGNLTRDAELRQTPSGVSVLSFSVAVNESRKNQRTDEREDYPNYIDCTMFGRRAEGVGKHLGKGVYVSLTGKLHQNRWQTQEGQNRSKLEVNVGEIHFERKQGAEPGEDEPEGYDATEFMGGDDIPF